MEVYLEWLDNRIYTLSGERDREVNSNKRKSLNDRIRELRLCLKNARQCS